MGAPANWKWHETEYDGCWDLRADGKLLAWLQKRPSYCDRGHWQVNVEVSGLDSADMFPRYYMRFEVAQQETEEFLNWRLNRVRSV